MNEVHEDNKKRNLLKAAYFQYFNFIFLIIILIFLTKQESSSQDLWLITSLDNPAAGYWKLDIGGNGNFFLLDNYGMMRFIDSSESVKNHSYWKILRNGNWSCYNNQKFKIFNENLLPLDTVNFPEEYAIDIHDIESLDNGHYMLLGIEKRIIDLSELIDGGKTDAEVEGVVLLEVDGDRNIYWTWNSFDFFDILDVTNDIDLTQQRIDFTHANTVTVDLDGNILLSSRHLDEITKINKTTGEIMWRWGGKKCKNNEFVFINDTIGGFWGFSHQHAITVLANGNYLMFDNGNMKPTQYSRTVEYWMDVANKRVTKVWEYSGTPQKYRDNSCNALRLSNGNTLINWRDRLNEVDPNGNVKFEISISPPFEMYRAFKYITKMNAKTLSISGSGLYDFNGGNKEQTKVKINVSSFNGTGNITVEKHDYAPPPTVYSDTNFTAILPFRWVISKSGLTGISGNFKINANELNASGDPAKMVIFKRDKETTGTFTALNTTYSSASSEISANITNFGEIIICSYELGNVSLGLPLDNSFGTNTSGTFSWQKIKGAYNYRIQVSTDTSFNNLVKNELTGNTAWISYSGLNYNTKYFWRVSAISNKDTSDWSGIRAFTTKLALPVLNSPQDNFIGIPLNANLSWYIVSGAWKYWIEVAGDSLFNNIIHQNKESVSNSEEVILEEYNEMFYWRVRAYRSSDTSDWSATRKFTTVLPAPSSLEPGNNEKNADISGVIKWSNIFGADSYTLQLAADSMFAGLLINENDIEVNEYGYEKLNYNSEYYWHVRSVRNTDSSDWSVANKFSTVLGALTLQTPEDSAEEQSTEIMFEWEAVTEAVYYIIQISRESDFSEIMIEEDSISQNQKLIKGLPAGSILYWRVMATAGEKHSKWSDIFRFGTAKGKPMDKPVLLNPKDNSVDLATSGYFRWLKVQGAEQYKLEVSQSEDFGNTYKTYDITNDTNILFEGYENETRYYWRVRALSVADSSVWSDVWSFSTSDNSSYPDIILNSPIDGVFKISIDGILDWNDVENAISYGLQISEDTIFSNTIYNEIGLKETSFSYNSLDFNTLYYWRVAAEFENHSLKWSEKRHFITELQTPVLISPVNNGIDIAKSGSLVWANVPGAAEYDIQLTDDSSFNNFLINVKKHGSTEIPYNLTDSTLYYWRVKSINENNKSKWSDLNNFTTKKVTGVHEYHGNELIRISPNPVNDLAHIYFSNNDNFTISITILNTLGCEIFKHNYIRKDKEWETVDIDLSDQPSGFYILVINKDAAIITLKLLKE